MWIPPHWFPQLVLDVSFVRGPSNVTVRSSQPVSLPCVPPRSIPVATILWYKDNVPFVPRPGEFEVKQLFTGTLQFNNVQIRDEGKYFCVAVNNYSVPSTRTSQVGSIIVREGGSSSPVKQVMWWACPARTSHDVILTTENITRVCKSMDLNTVQEGLV